MTDMQKVRMAVNLNKSRLRDLEGLLDCLLSDAYICLNGDDSKEQLWKQTINDLNSVTESLKDVCKKYGIRE